MLLHPPPPPLPHHDDLKRLLLSSGDAELWYFTGNREKPKVPKGEGNPKVKESAILFQELMMVRDCIRKFDKKCNLVEVSQF